MSIFNSLKSHKKYKLTDPFPWHECTSLVIYATKSLDDIPDKSFPSLIFDNLNAEKSTIHADKAPYLTSLDGSDMLVEINKWKNKPDDNQDYQRAMAAEKWIVNHIDEGWTHFLYETEPPKYAGNAYPWASFAEKERGKNKNQ